MQLFPPLSGFYEAIAEDPRIGATHISLYMALLQEWNLSGGATYLLIIRSEIMTKAKISARRTYNKGMNDLKDFGYITYTPAANSFTRSAVSLSKL